jgi:hypothetical protein
VRMPPKWGKPLQTCIGVVLMGLIGEWSGGAHACLAC